MGTRFFLGLLAVAALILGPIGLWAAFDLEGAPWGSWMRLPVFAGVGLGGYLLWGIVMRALLGRDGD